MRLPPSLTPARIRRIATASRPSVPSNRIDCGSGFHFGICPVCKRGHGFIMFSKPKP